MKEAAQHNIRAWVSIENKSAPSTDPAVLQQSVSDTIKALHDSGFQNQKVFIAAHGSATRVAQNYTIAHPDSVIGQILMGGSIQRIFRANDDSTGLTVFKDMAPTLTLAGTRDGLYRITRNAESYWHHVLNVSP